MVQTDWMIPRQTSWFAKLVAEKSQPSSEAEFEQNAPYHREMMRFYSGDWPRRETSLTRNQTLETFEMRRAYRQMIVEPAVKAAFLGKIGSVASQELIVLPAAGEEDIPRSREIAEFVQHCLVGPSGTSFELIWEIAHGGLMDGFSVCEKIRKPQDRGKWKGKWVLDKLKSHDSLYMQFEVDAYRNVIGIYNGEGGQPSVPFDPEDYCVFSYLPFFSNPQGMSDFRASFRAVELLVSAIKLRTLMLSKFTGPFLKGTYTDPKQRTRMEQELAKARSMGYIVCADGNKIEVLDLATKGNAEFQAAIDDLRKEIAIGLQGAFLQMLEGSSPDVRGNSSVQKDTSEIFSWLLSVSIASVVNRQIVPELVIFNFGSDCAFPRVQLGAVNPDDILKDLAIDKAVRDLGADISKSDVYRRSGRKPPIDANDTIKGSTQAQPFQNQFGMPTNPVAQFSEAVSSSGDAAASGQVGSKLRDLLDNIQARGQTRLQELVRAALNRLGTNRAAINATKLFSDDELKQFADSIAMSIAPAELLGRADIRAQAVKADGITRFAEGPSLNFGTSLDWMEPKAALDYFTKLVPQLTVDPQTFFGAVSRAAFTMAVSSEQTMLVKAQQTIREMIEAGIGSRQGGLVLDQLLDRLGVTPNNPQYAEMVYRTNAMDSFNSGAMLELQDPEVQDIFPVWQYLGIRDGRQGADHEPHFDKYYPATATFAEVRGNRPFNCRCTFRAVDKWEWAELQAKGIATENSW
jgi:hypothetical protein